MKRHILGLIKADKKYKVQATNPDNINTLHHTEPIARRFYPVVIKLAERYKVVCQYDYNISQQRTRAFLTLKVYYLDIRNARNFLMRLDLILKHIAIVRKSAVDQNKKLKAQIRALGKHKKPRFYKIKALRGKEVYPSKFVGDIVEKYEIKRWAKILRYQKECWNKGEKKIYREYAKFYKRKLGLYSHQFTRNPHNKNRILA